MLMAGAVDISRSTKRERGRAARPELGGKIDILEVVNEARDRGLSFPLVIRFQDLLRHRVESVNRAFQSAMGEFNYRGNYRGVFPIKVNQLREVIEEIVDAGQQFHFGLEAGSKPELVAALAMHKDRKASSSAMATRTKLTSASRSLVESLAVGRLSSSRNSKSWSKRIRAAKELVWNRTSASVFGFTAKAAENGRRAAARTRSSVSIPPVWLRPVKC